MKNPPLLPMIFVVIVLGFVHVQFEAGAHALPVKEIVALGVMIVGAGYLYRTAEPAAQDAVEETARVDDDLDRAA